MTRLLLGFALISMMMFVGACSDDNDEICNEEWSYDGINSPEFWGLCDNDCDGEMQSPIDITGAVANGSLAALNTAYDSSSIRIENNGHAIELHYDEGSTFNLDGTDYNLEQFHFHASSEHTINGVRYPLEMHMVHTSGGKYVVVSVLFEEGNENDFLANFSDDLPSEENGINTLPGMVDVQGFLPTNAGYYTYNGSLTTPKCTETVTWFVLKSPIEASADQLSSFASILQDNYRPIQDLNGREIQSFN